MLLDLSLTGQIPVRFLKIFHEAAADAVVPFHESLEEISRERKDCLDWFVSSPCSRNTLSSPFFLYCCKLLFLKKLLDKNESIDGIMVDSPALKKIINNFLLEYSINISVGYKDKSKKGLRGFLRTAYGFIEQFLSTLLDYIVNVKNNSKNSYYFNSQLTLIDTFTGSDQWEDLYYPGLLDKLSLEDRKNVFFVPSFCGCFPIKKKELIERMRSSAASYLFKEDFLKFNDYVYAWSYVFRLNRQKVDSCHFLGYDVASLINEELFQLTGFPQIVESLLNYRFAMRLKEAAVPVRLVVNWFENQIVDKGWNYGFRIFFPKVDTIGYQGFISTDYELNTIPTHEENRSKVIPKVVAVIGKALESQVKSLCPGLATIVAPAFRQQRLFRPYSKRSRNFFFTVLFVLPMYADQAKLLMQFIMKICFNYGHGVHFLLKKHPAIDLNNSDLGWKKEFAKKITIVNGRLNDLIEQSNLVVGTATSALLESIAKGVPVVVIANHYGLTYNPIPESIDKNFWELCYTCEELNHIIKRHYKKGENVFKDNVAKGIEVRDKYFHPVTRTSVYKFIRLDN